MKLRSLSNFNEYFKPSLQPDGPGDGDCGDREISVASSVEKHGDNDSKDGSIGYADCHSEHTGLLQCSGNRERGEYLK